MFIIILPKENRFLMIGSPVRYTDNRDLFDGNESVQQETLEFCYCSMILQVFLEIFLHTKLDLIQFMLVIPKVLANTSRGIKYAFQYYLVTLIREMSLSKLPQFQFSIQSDIQDQKQQHNLQQTQHKGFPRPSTEDLQSFCIKVLTLFDFFGKKPQFITEKSAKKGQNFKLSRACMG